MKYQKGSDTWETYSYPSFDRSGYDNYQQVINKVAEAGFKWITFHPAFMVVERGLLRSTLMIYVSRTPGYAVIERAVRFAARAGLNVKIEPHLDFKATLDGGQEDWRQRMYFNPAPPEASPFYGKIAITLMMDILVRVGPAFPDRCFALTLGSEVDVSLVEFATTDPGWTTLLTQLQKRRAMAKLDSPLRLVFGHKLNHDTLLWGKDLRLKLNRGRSNQGLSEVGGEEFRRKTSQVDEYLNKLDYVSFSFYPVVDFRKPDGNITNDDYYKNGSEDQVVETFAQGFARATKVLVDRITPISGTGGVFEFDEFGLGVTDPMHSYTTDPASFLDGKGKMTKEAQRLRRRFYKGFLRFLDKSSALFKKPLGFQCMTPATFWTAGHYDFLNAFGRKGSFQANPKINEEFEDSEIKEAVKTYNSLLPRIEIENSGSMLDESQGTVQEPLVGPRLHASNLILRIERSIRGFVSGLQDN